jgi:hypothetical protein
MMTEPALNIEAVRRTIREGLEAWVKGGEDCRQECRQLAAEVGIEEQTEKLIAGAQQIKWQRPLRRMEPALSVVPKEPEMTVADLLKARNPKVVELPAPSAKLKEVVGALKEKAKLREVGEEPEGELEFGKGNRPERSLGNTRLAVKKLGLEFSYNAFKDQYLVLNQLTLEEEAVDDRYCVTLRERIFDTFRFDPGKELVRDVVNGRCLANKFNPVQQYLGFVKWDGVPRLDTWVFECLEGIEDTPLHRAIGRMAICAQVRRAKRPGCKFDHAPVIEGDEGILKSLFVKELAGGVGPDYFSDQSILQCPSDKEVQELLRGRWVYELAELNGIKKSDNDWLKAFIVRTHDRGRPAYGHYVIDQPRTCVFWGTTNDQEYLIGTSGNRRWLPLGRCLRVNIGWIKEYRDRLFAEAVIAEANEKLYLPTALLLSAKALQESRRRKHPWEDTLSASGYSEGGTPRFATVVEGQWRVHTNTIFERVLHVPSSHLSFTHYSILSGCMQMLGWTKPSSVIRIGKEVANGYVREVRKEGV